MSVNDLEIPTELMFEENLYFNNIDGILKQEFSINEFKSIVFHDLRNVIRETNAVRKLCLEDRNRVESYWIGSNKNGLNPGCIDCEKIIVIANLDFDVPICLDYRKSLYNPEVIWLTNKGGWEKICDTYHELCAVITKFQRESN